MEQQPQRSTRRLSLAELGPSNKSTIALSHLNKIGLVNRRCRREVPHELTVDQQQRRVDDTCTKLLENPTDSRFWRRRIVTGDEMWWVFYRNANRENVWIKPAAQPTTVQVVAKQDRFAQKVMLCVWWNFEGIINHFELVQNGAVNAAALYSEQLDDRVYAALAARRYPAALINRKHALLQHDNAPAAHTAALIKAKIKELPPGIEFLPHPAYAGPDLAPPSDDYHLFRSMAHFLRRGRTFDSLEVVLENGCRREFFASKPAEWYRRGIEQLAQRWMKVIKNDGISLDE